MSEYEQDLDFDVDLDMDDDIAGETTNVLEMLLGQGTLNETFGTGAETTNVLEMILGPDYDEDEHDFSADDSWDDNDDDEYDSGADDSWDGNDDDEYDSDAGDSSDDDEDDEKDGEDDNEDDNEDEEDGSVFREIEEPMGLDAEEDGVIQPYIQVPSAGQNPPGLYEFGRFDPNSKDMSHIVGNPKAFIDNWHHQTGQTCALNAQRMVIEEMLGIQLEEQDLVDLALEKGWFDVDNGTHPLDMGKIMEAYNLKVTYQPLLSLEHLREFLKIGGCPIVGLDSNELWEGRNNEWFLPGRDANHAVQVIGIDESDPENPMVIINDSGVPDGAGVMVPGDLFMKAAEDNRELMDKLGGPRGAGFMAVAFR